MRIEFLSSFHSQLVSLAEYIIIGITIVDQFSLSYYLRPGPHNTLKLIMNDKGYFLETDGKENII